MGCGCGLVPEFLSLGYSWSAHGPTQPCHRGEKLGAWVMLPFWLHITCNWTVLIINIFAYEI